MCPLTGCGPDRKGKPAGSTLACLSLTKTASVNKPSDLCTHTTTTPDSVQLEGSNDQPIIIKTSSKLQ